MHYFTIEQRETLGRKLAARAAQLRREVSEDAGANLNAEPAVVALERDVVELREVEAALTRLHQPEFGLCVDCGGEIPYSRLSANPSAVRCVGCQARRERVAMPASRP